MIVIYLICLVIYLICLVIYLICLVIYLICHGIYLSDVHVETFETMPERSSVRTSCIFSPIETTGGRNVEHN